MSEKHLSFKKDSPEVQKLIEWWDELENKYRGERAVLRRCSTLSEVIFSPAYHRLRSALVRIGSVNDDGLAIVAGLAARVKDDNGNSPIAEQMAMPKNGSKDKAKVSNLRFRRLLKVKNREELFIAMTRIVALLGGMANLQSLARSVYLWDTRYIDIRKEWAFEYFSKAPEDER